MDDITSGVLVFLLIVCLFSYFFHLMSKDDY